MTNRKFTLASQLLAAAVVAIALGTVAATPALAHEGWNGERHEHEWRERGWRDHDHDWWWRYHRPYAYVAPGYYYAPPPPAVYAPPPASFNVVVPLNFR